MLESFFINFLFGDYEYDFYSLSFHSWKLTYVGFEKGKVWIYMNIKTFHSKIRTRNVSTGFDHSHQRIPGWAYSHGNLDRSKDESLSPMEFLLSPLFEICENFVFDIPHLHELVHDAFDHPFTFVLVRFLAFHAIEHLENENEEK